MSNNDAPAGSTGGPSVLADLPDKLRVHALAKLIGRTSREVLATLSELGADVRSAQSSVDRALAERVVTALLPDAGAEDETAVADDAYEDATETVPAPALPDIPADVAAAAAAGEAAVAADPVAAETDEAAAPPRLFAAPVFQAPAAERRPTRRARAVSSAPEAADPFRVVEPPAPTTGPADSPADTADDTVDETTDDTDTDSDEATDADDSDDDASGRRRRRRGRRGRGRGKGSDADNGDSESGDSDSESDSDSDSDSDSADAAASGSSDDAADSAADSDDTDSGDDDGDESDDASDEAGGSRRRRRRRRRRGGGDDAESSDDPPGTVTRVRAPRDRSGDDEASDGVQSVRGSTRLEAKRQRRRDGRDAGRRRVPILTEAEFLARRESVDRSMVVREHGDRIEIAVLEDDVLVEHFVAGGSNDGNGPSGSSMVGNIHLGRVQNVLPSMEAAFVDIGRGRNAVLYAGEVDWDAAGLNGKARRIEQALSTGDSVLVQVTKDPIGHKGARLTTQISLAGRFLVYVPSGGTAGISRKLPDTERKRLKDMLKEIVPSEAGVIIRTASEGVTQEALERDVRRLQAQWDVVKTKADATGPGRVKAPALLYEEPDLLVKVVRDQFNEDFTRLVVSGDDAFETVSNYIGHVAPELSERLHRHVGPTDVFTEYRIDEQLLKALDRKVWLPSGGTLVIDRTEAMTVVDVNTGKFTGSGGNLEETVTRNNLEAAEEIVRQLRLRDIGGIIVVDFIDMVLEANRDLVLRRLTECLARDRTRHQVAEVTSLGLVQMTRKRVGGGLLEHFSTPCEHCRGRGVIVSTDGDAKVDKGGDHKHDKGGDRQNEREGRRGRNRNRRDDARPEQTEERHSASADIAVVAASIAAENKPASDDKASGDRPSGDRASGTGAEPPALRLAGADDPDGAPSTPEAPAAPDAPAASEAPSSSEHDDAPRGRTRRVRSRRGATSPDDATPVDAAPVDAAPVDAAPVDAGASAVPAPVDSAVAGSAATEEVPAVSAPATTDDTPPAVAGHAERNGAPATNGAAALNGHDTSAPAPAADANGVASRDEDAAADAERPRRRRGRVTRTAGSPSGAAAAVITAPLPAPASEESAAAPVTVAPQPEPVTEPRPRRQRRTASRPAGPPSGTDE